MKKLVCAVCGGTDFIKEKGMFVCDICGTVYTPEQACQLMMGVDELLKLAEEALKDNRNSLAESYATKLLALDKTHARAWLIKGEAVGWQTSPNKPRLSEAATCFKNALENAAKEDQPGYAAQIRDQGERLSRAFINLTAKNFGELPCAENTKRIREAIGAMMTMQLDLMKLRIIMDSDGLYDHFSSKLNSAAVTGSDKADKDFGPEKRNKTKAAWDLWRERSDQCLEVLKLAMEMCESRSRLETIQKNYKIIVDNIINSCSYKYQSASGGYVKDYSLTREAIQTRLRSFAEFCKNVGAKTVKLERKEKEQKEKEQQAKNEKYWAAHPEEKAALDKELKELEAHAQALEEELEAIEQSVEAQIRELEEKRKIKLIPELDVEEQEKLIRSLVAERDSMGFFQGRAKKAIEIRLTKTEYPRLAELKELAEHERLTRDGEIDRKIASLHSEGEPLRKELKTKEERIRAIRAELTKPR